MDMESNKWVGRRISRRICLRKLSFNDIICLDGYVWLFYRANKALKVGIHDGKIVVAEEFQQPIDNSCLPRSMAATIYLHVCKGDVVCSYRKSGLC